MNGDYPGIISILPLLSLPLLSLLALPAIFTGYRRKRLNIAIALISMVVVASSLLFGLESLIWSLNHTYVHGMHGGHFYLDNHFYVYMLFAAVPVLFIVSSVIVAKYVSLRGCVIWGSFIATMVILGAMSFYWVDSGTWLIERFGHMSYTFMLVQSVTAIPLAYLLRIGTRLVLRVFTILIVFQGLLFSTIMPLWFYAEMPRTLIIRDSRDASLFLSSITSLLLICMMVLCFFVILHAVACLHPRAYRHIFKVKKAKP